MATVKKMLVPVGGEKRVVAVIDHSQKSSKPKVEDIHHIFILDRSGSMYSEINGLIDDVQKSFNHMGKNDYLSIIWFSSPKQFRTLVKGARKTDDIKKLLDSIRSTLGTTCFSDPLKEASTIVDELKSLCPNISVTLFTDGQPVVPWSRVEEENKCLNHISKMASSLMAFNTIGYGYYYDRSFLVNISGQTQFGSMIHSSRIDEFYNIFNINWEKVIGLVAEPINVVAGGKEILYLNSKTTKLVQENLELRQTDKERNHVFIVGGPKATDFRFVYNNEIYNTSSLPEIVNNVSLRNDFWYAMAYELFYHNNRLRALDIMAKDLKDKYFVDLHINTFTYDEIGRYLGAVKSAIFDPKKRLQDGLCTSSYVPKKDALCVMDVLNTLSRGESYYLPFSDNVKGYQRIGRKVEDKMNVFTPAPDIVRAPLSDFIFNKEHLNLSIRFAIEGKVKLNPSAAKRVGLPKEVDSRIFRTHTIIKDGNINLQEAEFMVDGYVYEMLKKKKVPMKVVDECDEGYNIVISFNKLPIINRTYIDKSLNIDDVFDTTEGITRLEAFQKVLRYYLDKVYKEFPVAAKEGQFKSLTLDQIKVLEDHGLDKNFTYGGVDVVKPRAEDSDSYETRTMVFYLKGCSTLPKVEEVLERVDKGKALNLPGQLMLDGIKFLKQEIKNAGLSLDKPSVKLRDTLLKLVHDQKVTIFEERVKLNTIKLAKIVTGDWFDGLLTDDKGNFIYNKGGNTMIARADRTVEYV